MCTPRPPAARMPSPGTSPCYPPSSCPGAGCGGPWGSRAGQRWGGRGCWGPSICIGPAPCLLHNGQVSMAPVLGNGPCQWASRPGTASRSPWSSSVCHRSLGVCGPEEVTSAPAGLLGQASGAVGCGRGGLSSSGPATGPIAAGGSTAETRGSVITFLLGVTGAVSGVEEMWIHSLEPNWVERRRLVIYLTSIPYL